MTIWKQLRMVSFMIPEQLLAAADQAAKDKYMSRSEYIRYALNKATQAEQLKVWDDAAKATGIPRDFLDMDDS